MTDRLSDELKAELRDGECPSEEEVDALLNEIDALRERAEAAERRAGERWKLAEGWRQAFKGEQRSHDKARVRIRKLEAALRPFAGFATAADGESGFFRINNVTDSEIVFRPSPELPALVAGDFRTAREALTRQSEANQCDGCRRGLPIDGDGIHIEQDGKPTMVCTADLYQSEAGQPETREGKVVITTNEQGDCVAVTRQDDEGRILSVIWERPSPPPQGNAEPSPDVEEALADFPRRRRMDKWSPAEKAIHDAVQAVEAMDADPRLTDAVALLGEAQEAVADFVDGVESTPIDTLRASRGVPESVRRLPDQFMELENGSRRASVIRMAAYRHAAQMVREAIAEADQGAAHKAGQDHD